MLALGRPFQPSLMLVSMAGVNPNEASLGLTSSKGFFEITNVKIFN